MLNKSVLISPKNLYSLDRPREKLFLNGPNSLDDLELLTVLIGSGTKQRNVSEIALDLYELINSSPNNLSLSGLEKINGLSTAKAGLLLAAFELVRRHTKKLEQVINTSEDILPWVADIAKANQEHLVLLTLNGAGQLIQRRIITIGTLDSTLIHPREVFSPAIIDHAASIILVHNHPSGETKPSDLDIKATKIIQDAGYLLGIPLLDHVIVNRLGQMFSIVNSAEQT